MAVVAQQYPSASANIRSSPVQVAQPSRNPSVPAQSSTMSAPQPAGPPPKKGKGKKNADPNDASKQIAAKIAQLEQDAAGDKEQEAEIGA